MNLNKMLSSRVTTPAAASGWNRVALWTRSSVASVLCVTISQCDPQCEPALGALLLTRPYEFPRRQESQSREETQSSSAWNSVVFITEPFLKDVLNRKTFPGRSGWGRGGTEASLLRQLLSLKTTTRASSTQLMQEEAGSQRANKAGRVHTAT